MKITCLNYLLAAAISLVCWTLVGLAADTEAAILISRIRAVGREGQGNRAAAEAWKQLAQRPPEVLPLILEGMDGTSPTAANWLRAAVDAIAEKALKAKKPLPAARLENFVRDTVHDPAARRLAYEWLVKVDDTSPSRLLPGMLNDPSVELRRDAVARLLAEGDRLAKHGDKLNAKSAYQRALSGARDQDQVDALAKHLKDYGQIVDLPAHFGFVQRWALVGPFDNTGGRGFATVYTPEKAVNLMETYVGKSKARISWKEHETKDPYGLVDLNVALTKHMGAVAYAYARVNSPQAQYIQLRAGSNNAVKIFLNGSQVFFREEYHHGMGMDQHVGTGLLRRGVNEILVKICQNEQKETWAQSWSFQLRLCDKVGGAVTFTNITGKPGTGRVSAEKPR